MNPIERLMPPVSHADLGDIELAYWDVGPKDDPTPVIFCHGFPELAFSWRHQLRAFENAGRRAIAPDMRGYGLTGRPEAVEAYDMEHLTGDLIRLMDVLGIEKAIFAGHDWGGIIVWQMPLMHPDRVAGVIGLNTPFMPRPPADPIAIMRRRFGERMYIVSFQTYGRDDAVLGKDARRAMDFFMRRPLEGTPPATGGLRIAEGDSGAEQPTFALVDMLQAWDPTFDPRAKFLTDEEFEVFARTFQRTGFTGGINWYRNFTRNWERSAGLPTKVTCPALMVMAEKDAVLPPDAANGMETHVPDLEKRLIEGSGHWTQQERPEEVNRVLLDWLDRRFPR